MLGRMAKAMPQYLKCTRTAVPVNHSNGSGFRTACSPQCVVRCRMLSLFKEIGVIHVDKTQYCSLNNRNTLYHVHLLLWQVWVKCQCATKPQGGKVLAWQPCYRTPRGLGQRLCVPHFRAVCRYQASHMSAFSAHGKRVSRKIRTSGDSFLTP
jgi:hypothetical protein